MIAKDATVGGKRVAVIVDEAHSSQSGDAAQSLKKVLGGDGDPLGAAEAEASQSEAAQLDDQDVLAAAVTALSASRRSRAAAARTCRSSPSPPHPRARRCSCSARRSTEGGTTVYEPFHLYSMRQAIEEGFILDVLANYVTYKRYYRLANGLTSDDPEVEKGKAAVALARFVDLHPSNLDQRAEIIVEHFRTVTAGKIGGQAKAMVVTAQPAARRPLSRRRPALPGEEGAHRHPGDGRLLRQRPRPRRPRRCGAPRRGLNGFPETQTKQRFHDEGQLLIVAEKYQTGFDEPLLHTMYVDKKLEGVKAVQTLSRLNRITAGKEDTFVLDFVNTAEEMREQFAPFYESSWTEETDPQPALQPADPDREPPCHRPGRAAARRRGVPARRTTPHTRRSRPTSTRP